MVALEQSPTEFLFLANIYSRVFQISDSQLGIWYPAKDETIRVVGFSVDRLQPFDATQILTNKKSEGFYCKAEPNFELRFSTALPEGTHSIVIPPDLQDELLIVAPRPVGTADVAVCSVFVLDPTRHQVSVYPQKWFTGAKFDTGYQWITRVCRDPRSTRIIGDGVRIGSFLLDGTNCQLDHWL